MVLNSGVGTPFGDSRIVRLNTAIIKTVDFLERRSGSSASTTVAVEPGASFEANTPEEEPSGAARRQRKSQQSTVVT